MNRLFDIALRSTVSLSLLTACDRAQQSGTDSATTPEWALVEDLRIGGAEDGPESFSDVHSMIATSDGSIFVLETKDQEVRVFDRDGKFLRRAARRGKGPGEIEYGTGLAISRDTVWVSDPRNGRFSSYNAAGDHIAQVTIVTNGHGDVWRGVADDSGRIVDLPVRIPQGGVDPRTKYPVTKDHIRFLRANGVADTVSSPECGREAPTFVFKARAGYITSVQVAYAASQLIAVTSKGTVWCTPSSEYRLLVGPIGGALREVVKRDVVPTPVTETERKEAQAFLDKFALDVGPLVDSEDAAIPTVKPAIDQIHADTEGQLWVRPTGTPDSTPAFDVFDAQGKQLARVQSPAPIGYSTFITATHLFTVMMDKDDVPTVVRYRIVK